MLNGSENYGAEIGVLLSVLHHSWVVHSAMPFLFTYAHEDLPRKAAEVLVLGLSKYRVSEQYDVQENNILLDMVYNPVTILADFGKPQPYEMFRPLNLDPVLNTLQNTRIGDTGEISAGDAPTNKNTPDPASSVELAPFQKFFLFIVLHFTRSEHLEILETMAQLIGGPTIPSRIAALAQLLDEIDAAFSEHDFIALVSSGNNADVETIFRFWTLSAGFSYDKPSLTQLEEVQRYVNEFYGFVQANERFLNRLPGYKWEELHVAFALAYKLLKNKISRARHEHLQMQGYRSGMEPDEESLEARLSDRRKVFQFERKTAGEVDWKAYYDAQRELEKIRQSGNGAQEVDYEEVARANEMSTESQGKTKHAPGVWRSFLEYTGLSKLTDGRVQATQGPTLNATEARTGNSPQSIAHRGVIRGANIFQNK
ncbi:hypothetical protein B0J14DRAFT_563460 [Halenospora varia]|nr:hypothetical protein B0J14DRAFT_563460 [Halenospora varia]